MLRCCSAGIQIQEMEQRGDEEHALDAELAGPFGSAEVYLRFCVTAAIIVDILAHRAEPFVRQQVVQALSERFHAHVELDSFHLSLGNTLRGEWGVWGEGKGLRIWPPAEVEGVQVPLPKPPMAPLVRLD